jgi:UDPglucose--hexose-1-phosphate uridylyltransferase
LVFKNVGSVAGASLEHSHSQLIATPIIPRNVADEMEGMEEFYRYRGRCLLCDMIQQEIATETRVVLDNPSFVAFAPSRGVGVFVAINEFNVGGFDAMSKAAIELITELAPR